MAVVADRMSRRRVTFAAQTTVSAVIDIGISVDTSATAFSLPFGAVESVETDPGNADLVFGAIGVAFTVETQPENRFVFAAADEDHRIDSDAQKER